MAKFDFRILLETVEGKKTSYISQSFVDTSVDLVLSASQVYNRITGSVSCSYQNQIFFSGSDFNTSKTFKDNSLLSSSLVGGLNTGSIDFDATDTEYDRLLRYKFFGDKVCNVLGIPNNQWIYVDQVRFPADDESNIFQGNIDVNNAFISDTLTFANNANISSDIPFYIDTGSDRYIKFIDTRGTGNASLIFGYDKDTDSYEINASDDTEFNIRNLNNLTVGTITASIFHQETTTDIDVLNTTLAGITTVSGALADEPLLRVQGNVSSSGEITSSTLLVTGTSQFDGNSNFTGDITVGGSVTANEFVTNIISTADGSNTFGNSIDDIQTLTGSVKITGSLNLPDDAQINLGNDNDLQIFHRAGVYSRIKDNGTGALQLSSNRFKVMNSGNNETMIDATQNAGVDLYFDDSKKLETTTDGIIVTGEISASDNVYVSSSKAVYFNSPKNTTWISGSDNTGVDLTIRADDDIRLVADDDVVIMGGGHLHSNVIARFDGENRAVNVSGDITASGDISASGELFATDLTLNGSGLNIVNDSGFEILGTGTGIMNIGSERDLVLLAGSGRTNTADEIHFGSAGVNSQMVLKDGKLGIGTTIPSEELHIVSGTIFTDGPGSEIKIGRGGYDTYAFRQSSGTGLELKNITDDRVEVKVQNARVGIGVNVTNPSATLHISSSNDPNLIIEDPNGSALVRFKRTDTSKVFDLSMQGSDLRFTPTDTDGSMNVLVGVNASSEKIDSRLGIGKPTPSEALDVSGSMNISGPGHITASGNITAVSMSGDGSQLTGVTGEWDGTLDGDAQITGSLIISGAGDTKLDVLGNINASGNISSSLTSSFGKLTIGTSTPDHRNTQLTVKGGAGGSPIALFERIIGGSGEVAINMNSSDPQVRFHEGSDFAAIGQDSTNSNLVFATGSTVKNKEAMVIDTDGKVGIGTISPDTLLHIEAADSPTFKIEDTTNNATLQAAAIDSSVYIGATSNHAFNLRTNNTNRVTILNGGNVGIGITSPKAPLHVVGNISASADIDLYGNPSTINFVTPDESNAYIKGSTGALDLVHSQGNYEAGIRLDTQGNIKFASDHNSGLDFSNTHMIISHSISDGNAFVGIGTIYPTTKLQVEGNISSSGFISTLSHITASGNISSSGTLMGNDLILHNAGGVSAEIQSSTGDSFIRFTDGGSHKFSIGFDNGDSTFAISTGSGLSGNQAITIESDGNVGIGTSNPALTLDVAGDVRVQGAGRPNIRFITETETTQIADSFTDTTDKAYIRFDDQSDSNDSGFILHETRHAGENNEGVLHLCPSDDNQTGDYVSIHGTNDADVIKLHTSGLLEGVSKISSSDDLVISDGTRTLQYDVSAHALKSNGATLDFNGTDFSFNTNDLFIDQSNSRIGIGTTSPQTLLHVVGNIRVEAGSNETQNIQFFESSVERARIEFDSSTANDFSLQTADNSDALQDRLTIKTSQDATAVGIGTTSPTKPLQVTGDISASGDLNITNITSSGNLVFSGSGVGSVQDRGVYFGAGATVEAYIRSLNSGGNELEIGSDNRISFTETDTDNVKVEFDLNSGKVGIGTTTESDNDALLTVAGNISSSGLGFFGGSIGVNGVSQSLSTFTTYPGLYVKQSDTDGGPLGSQNILIGGVGDIAPTNAKLKMYLADGTNDGVLTTYQFGSSLKLKAGVSSSVYPHNWSQILIKDTGTTMSPPDGFIQFWTSGSQRAVINDSGNFGIGTTSPESQLTINHGSNTIASETNAVTAASKAALTITGSGGIIGQISMDNNEIHHFGQDLFIQSQGDTSGEGNIKFRTGVSGKSDRMILTGDGHLGIGTFSPLRKFSVDGGSDGTVANFTGNATNGTLVDISGSGTNPNAALRFQGNNQWTIGLDDTSFVIADGNNFMGSISDSLKYLVVKNDGNIGIGTTSPDYALDVAGDVGVDKFIYHNGDADTYFRFNDSEDAVQISAGGSHLNFDGTGLGVGVTATEKFDVGGNIKARGNISSPTFESGFAGSGFRITSGSDGKQSFTIDELTVRGTMSVFELLIHQIRATNGSLFVSNTGKLLTASLSSVDNHFSMSFDTGSGYGHSFQVGDLVRAQRFVPSTNGSGSQVFKSDLHIVAVNGTGSAVGVLSGSGNALETPQPGYEYVRIGSTTTTDRQGSIYLTADDDNAPFIDVIDQVTSHSHFNTSGRVKTRIGKLDGITTSTRFGTLSGYGFYASGSAFLEGSINATSGSIGDFIIDDKEIRDSNNDLRLKSTGEITGSKVLFDGGKIGGWTINETTLTGGSATINSTGVINLGAGITLDANTNSGQIQVSNRVQLNGNTTSTIGGFTIDTNEFSSGDFKLNTDVETLQLGTVTDFAKDGSDKGLFVSGTGDFFIGKEDKDFIHFDASTGNLEISSSNIKVEVDDLHITASDIDMTTDSFELNATDIDISSTGKSISLGEGKIDLVGGSTSTITIGAANSIKFSDDGTDRFMTIGSKTSFSHFDQSTAGLILGTDNGTSKFEIVADTNNYLSFNGTAFDLKSTNTTLSGSSVEIQTPSFMFGDKGTSFISSSTSQIEISSSAFHLQNNGQVTGSKVLFDGGTIGGFEIDANNLKSTDENIILNSNGKRLSIGSSTFGGRGFQVEYNGGDPKFHIGRSGHTGIKFEGSQLQITSSKVDISGSDVSIQSPKVFLGTGDSNFISASDGNIEISSSNFHLQNNGDLTGSSVLFDGGKVGGFEIDEEHISAGSTLVLDSAANSGEIRLGAATNLSNGKGFYVNGAGSFRVGDELTAGDFVRFDGNGLQISSSALVLDTGGNLTISGTLSSSVGNIGGFTLDSSEIKSNNASGDTGLRLKAGGQITASNAKITGDIVANTITANTAGTIGGFGISATTISSSTGTLILRNNGQITASAVSMSGHITAETGTIGGFNIGADLSNTAGGSDALVLKGASGQLTASAAKITGDITATSGEFTGQIEATHMNADSGSIGGFTIGPNEISASGLLLKSTGQLTASSVDLSGKINATSGEIGAIVVSSDRLQSSESADSANNNIFEINKDGTIQIGKFEGGSSPFIITDIGKSREFPSLSTTPGGFSIGNINNSGYATLQRRAPLISINGDECKININQITGSKLFIDETSFLKGDVTTSGNISSSATITAEHFFSSDDIVAQGKISASGNIEGSLGKFYRNESFPQLQLSDDNGSDILNIGQSGNVGYFKTSDTSNDFQFRRSDNEDLMRLDMSALRVGINTTSPSKRLHINNSGILIDGGSSIETGDLATRFVIDAGASTSHNLMDLRNDHGTLLFVDGNNDANDFARVGIGITDPVDPLQVMCDSDGHGLTLEENGGNETYTIGVDSDGDLNFYNSGATTPSMKLDDGGDLGIGTGNTNPQHRLMVKGNTTAISASGFIRFANDHFTPGAGTPQMQLTRRGDNGGNNDGFVISYLGFDNSSNPPMESERFLNFAVNNGSDGNIYIGRFRGDEAGGIETTGIAFTGRHPSVMNSGSYELGMIVESTGEVWAKSNTGVGTGIPKVQISTTDASKKVFGVIGKWSGDYDGYKGLHGVGENEIDVSINSIGEGLIWVTNKNGNIENGDFIVSSVISGYGQQQNDDLLRSSTVAKCTETIDWDNVTETITYNGVQYKKYLCTCTYHCG